MNTILSNEEYPKDFYYHRTSSPTYRKYLHTCGLETISINQSPQYAWVKRIFGNFFGIVKYERIDIEPDIDYIKSMTGLRHAFIVWIPYSRTRDSISKSWRDLLLTDHFQETGYAVLDSRLQSDISSSGDTKVIYDEKIIPHDDYSYLSSWNNRAKRARKKFLASGAKVAYVSPEVFIQAFLDTRVRHWYKRDYIRYYRKMVSIDPHTIRQWLAYDPYGKVIGGLAVHDFMENHSVHLVAFTDRKGYIYQPGTGLIDTWFSDSQKKGFTYLSFDQLRNRYGPSDQKGYTQFKENFLSARLSFPKAYFRFF